MVTAVPIGPDCGANDVIAGGGVVQRIMLTSFDAAFEVIMSALPSPLKSATVTDAGFPPTGNYRASGKTSQPVSHSDDHRVCKCWYRKINDAITVEISDRNGIWIYTERDCSSAGKISEAIA